MARLTKEQLEKIKKKYGVNELYSWSRVDKFRTSQYEYYLQYVLGRKPDIENCAYAPLGGIIHTIIERYYGDIIQFEDMIDEFEDGFLTAIDISDLKFDRNDETKNSNIKEKYRKDLTHFFKNHQKIKTKVELERFLTAKIGDYVLQGYADVITKNEDGYYVIIDWKSSTQYSNKELEEHSGQLTTYAIALTQLGVPLEKIKVAFCFLKYVTIQYKQKNGAVKTRDVERVKIGESLQSNAKMWLKEFGYEDQIDEYLKLLLDANSIEVLPKEVQDMYVVSDCYTYIPLNQKLVDKWTSIITSTIKDIELRTDDYEATGNERLWWDTEESVKAQSFYFATLSGFSANLHKPYGEYLAKLEAAKNNTDIFGGVGTNVSIDDSLDWLNDI